MKKKVFTFVLCFAALLSVSLNIYCLVPRTPSTSIASGTYVAAGENGDKNTLLVHKNNEVDLYGGKNEKLLTGTLEFSQNENCYYFKTDAKTYKLLVRDNVIYLPVNENSRTVSKLFSRMGDG